MRIERELLKGVLPLVVLKVLNRQAMYGYELVMELAMRSDDVLKLGQSTLYPLLYNLEAQGLVKGEWATAQSGRERKYYRLTDKGKKRLTRDLSQWEALVHGIGHLVTGSAQVCGATLTPA